MTAAPLPTDAELAILRVLWDHGPATVRQVFDALVVERGVGYTTVLKFLQIMHEKGLVVRDDSSRTHVYRAAVPRARTQKRLVRDLLDRAFDGSPAALVQQALWSGRSTPEELNSIRALLDQLEAEGG